MVKSNFIFQSLLFLRFNLDQSSTSEDDDSVKQSIEETISDYALIDAKFDNGENDRKFPQIKMN